MKKIIKKFFSITTSMAIVSSVLTLPNGNTAMAASMMNNRIGGIDRYETSALISEKGWTGTSDYALIATGEDFPDALCAAPLAKKYNAPIILTNKSSLNGYTKAELQRLKIKNAIIVGGTGVVSQNTENQIKALGINTSRIAGINRFETSKMVAEKIGTSSDIAIATGMDFPDALSIAPIAAIKQMPILLTEKNSIPNEIQPYLKNNIANTYVVGGTGVISDNIKSQLKNPIRLAGQNRYETNIAVLNRFNSDLNLSEVYIATGNDFPDALSCSGLACNTSSPIILSDSNLDITASLYVSENLKAINNVTAIGGNKIVSNSLIQDIINVPSSKITYKDGIDSVDRVFSGLQYLTDAATGIPYGGYNYYTKSKDNTAGFNLGLSTISAYMATGNTKYLDTAKKTADFLEKVLPSTGLLPEYYLSNKSIKADSQTFIGSGGQSSALIFVSYLARIDSSYIPLMKKLANGIINYGINGSNQLPWFWASTINGRPISTSDYGYESQSGTTASSCAEALLAAYETDKSNYTYKDKALSILNSVWNTRNRSTNLIPETWDVMNNRVGTRLYPNGNFRYDDMGGAYIRALMFAYSVTNDSNMLNILKIYTPTFANAVWDTSINGGAFRYLTDTNGQKCSTPYLETMHGVFIATLLEASSIIRYNNADIVQKCKDHADHIFMSDFGVKNYMVPHMLHNNGSYVNSTNDSQLGYAAIQFPLGYGILSQITGDNNYRLRDNQIINTMLLRHKMGDNINSPEGYASIVETRPPYGIEMSYGSQSWMNQAMYISSYLLYNSICPNSGVKIDWQYGLAPSVFGLAYDMPFWNLNNVNVKGKTLHLERVSGKGNVDLTDMGLGNIKSVKCDNQSYSDFTSAILNTESGTHSYDISWED